MEEELDLTKSIHKANEAWDQSIGSGNLLNEKIRHLERHMAVVVMYNSIATFWESHGAATTEIWKEMQHKQRELVVRVSGSDKMPLERDEMQLVPELNVAELSHPISGIPQQIQQLLSLSLQDHYLNDAEKANIMLKNGTATAKYLGDQFFCLIHEKDKPMVMEVTANAKPENLDQIQSCVEMGSAIEGPTWEVLTNREYFYYHMLARVCQEFQEQVFAPEKKVKPPVSPLMCCTFCGKPPMSKPLKKCTKCLVAQYCNDNCLKSHRTDHKATCKKHKTPTTMTAADLDF